MDRANVARHNPRPLSRLPPPRGAGPYPGMDWMRSITLVSLLALAFAAPAFAEAPAKGDAKNGKKIAYTCTGCHGITGYSNAYPYYRVPRISGQNYEYLVAALTGYRNGTRKHATMNAQAESLSEQDIADIAAHLSTAATP